MKVLLAVSGGIDSMYMLHRAPELFPGALCAVAHCNFRLRGAESDGDEAFVREACQKLGIDCYVERFDTAEYAAGHGVSIEMAARELRYAWFSRLCATHGFDVLATAHNANDNAETLLLNLLRGTGTKGLRGIPACVSSGRVVSPQSVATRGCSGGTAKRWDERSEGSEERLPSPTAGGDNSTRADGRSEGSEERLPSPTAGGVQLIRPLLKVTREEIRKWMQEKRLPWREDRTNSENEARRNMIRNKVFPVFAQINPSFVKTLGEDIERIRQTDDIADDYYRDAAEKIVKRAPGNTGDALPEIDVKGLLQLKHWRYVLWRILEDYGFSAETFGKLCTLLERYRTEPSGTVTLSGKTFEAPCWRLSARRKTLVLRRRD